MESNQSQITENLIFAKQIKTTFQGQLSLNAASETKALSKPQFHEIS